MNYRTISLDEIMKYLEKEEIQQLLKSFKGFNDGTSTPHDVEVFLHQKAVEFERSAIASTYLVFSTDSRELVGFFSLANRPLYFSKQNYQTLTKSQRKKISRSGRTLKGSGSFLMNSFLIGQLGKNYKSNTSISGKELLTLACDKVKKASKIINTKYIWLECDNNPKLIQFYQNFGFTPIDNFESENGLKVFVMKIQK
ncbi:hypothetical protein SpyM6JRS4_06050 [Streptococcus pyogenes JRS4]|nr:MULTISPECIES: GNAT family N-acetyltransferase [Streptococcus]EFY03056.1 hypothetical phage protein [Streptococcus dysgalactiae subsp. dysgalactiae ATCC 27957]HER4585194.1 GNAT family N-acetyltransferase [Streptococcus pyogenes NGAS618]HER4598735.1 GNAT family N-acetyltransferase [Streptococcus pyogenes NGAS606]HER4613416.1 GNAT family N-acetyltransferase [Streptococcus pyogenes NGAS603]HER4635801.1 GNAT family N-acetyltransferase [Streptococcus pyogenes NGAS510]HER4689507.1 GNAT family N-a